MKTLLTIIVFGLLAEMGWCECEYKVLPNPYYTIWEISGSYKVHISTQYVVNVGTHSCLLSDFVSSGKFCEWRGCHSWEEDRAWIHVNDSMWDGGKTYRCNLCNVKQKK